MLKLAVRMSSSAIPTDLIASIILFIGKEFASSVSFAVLFWISTSNFTTNKSGAAEMVAVPVTAIVFPLDGNTVVSCAATSLPPR